jgi:hypothetical protein
LLETRNLNKDLGDKGDRGWWRIRGVGFRMSIACGKGTWKTEQKEHHEVADKKVLSQLHILLDAS